MQKEDEASHTHKQRAVALKYDIASGTAPTVEAKGTGKIAEKIISLAEEHDIPIHRDEDLVELLATVDEGERIPLEAFVAVAEILRYIYSLNGKLKDIHKK